VRENRTHGSRWRREETRPVELEQPHRPGAFRRPSTPRVNGHRFLPSYASPHLQLNAAQRARRLHQPHPLRQRIDVMSSATPTRPGPARHLAIAISIRACLAGHRVAFATATEWVARLAEAKRQDGLDAELRRLSFIPLLVVDEVGYG
jgi:hypothetical protein